MQKISIKNMVCPRCISAVNNVLDEMEISPNEVRLGEVLLQYELTKKQESDFKSNIENLGFELLDNKNAAIVNQIKTLLVQEVQKLDGKSLNLSDFISDHLHKEYSKLSKLFSATNGITIEQFYIMQKIEKVKELLVYDELSLKEIAFQLGYSSSAHLSAQFKKLTGLTPTAFKLLGNSERKGIDKF